MKLILKVIKKKDFKVNEETHTHYSCAYKGRVFGVSTLRFNKNEFKVKDDILSMEVDVELKKNVVDDPITGTTSTFLDLMPKLDISLADI